MKKIFLCITSILVICLLFSSSNFKAANKKITVDILVGSPETVINNVVLDDGTRLSDVKNNIEIVEKSKPKIEPRYFGGYDYYFEYAAWIKRDGVDTLSLKPTDHVRYNRSNADAAWKLISDSKNGLGYHPGFSNYTSLKNQYYCHFELAKFKDKWNLEANRKVVSWFEMRIKGCNP